MAEFGILTVCAGNVHRSALAAALLTRWVGWYLPAPLAAQIHVFSAGTTAPAGARMGTRAQAIAAGLGADGSDHRATQLTGAMVSSADLVLVASTSLRDAVLAETPSAVRRTFTIREAGRAAQGLPQGRPLVVRDLAATVARLSDVRTASSSGGDDIIDPQGRDDDAYLRMVSEEVPPLAYIARALFGMSPADLRAYVTASADPAPLLASVRKADRAR